VPLSDGRTTARMQVLRQQQSYQSHEVRLRQKRQNRNTHTVNDNHELWFQKLPKELSPFSNIWTKICTSCSAKLLGTESDQWCYYKGRLSLPALPQYPESMKFLFNEENLTKTNMLCRKINNLFSFSVLGVHMGNFRQFRGPANVVLQGRTYHRLIDVTSGQHSLRWFLYDEAERTSKAIMLRIPEDWKENIRQTLEDINPYVGYARQLDREADTSTTEIMALELRSNPISGEIAAVIHSGTIGDISPRSVCIWKSGQRQPEFISILNEHYESLQYPLLFPHGTLGWGKRQHETAGWTQMEWYRYRLLTEPRFLNMGRLTCEYIVDMFSRMEDERLDYIKMGRKEQLRQQREAQSISTNPDESSLDPEQSFLLPASFVHSKLWASNQVADSLTLCRKFGKPSLFLTITTNPKWPEIVSQLRPGQTASDIPIIVCRVFHARIKKLYDLLKTYFDGLAYFVRVIEFQKRGLPHAHMLMKVCYIMLISLFTTN
jgi:Helitron helicase-like domain at N-terminus